MTSNEKLNSLWKSYKGGIKNFILSRVENSADADEILQEVLIKTYKSVESIDKEESIGAWIFQVTRNTITDYYRKTSKSQVSHSEDLSDFSYEPEKGLPSRSSRELAQCILPFINNLPTEMQEILIAIEINGESQKDYAKRNNINYSTLKSKLKKSREELRILFEDCCHIDIDKRGQIYDHTKK